MPLYVYRCRDCSHEFECWHSMSEKKTDCEHCNTSGSLFKIPCLSEDSLQVSRDRKAGAIVDEYIRNVKEEIKKEKRALKDVEM